MALLFKYEITEEYEICARIVKTIEYEKQEALRNNVRSLLQEEDENDEPLIDEINKAKQNSNGRVLQHFNRNK